MEATALRRVDGVEQLARLTGVRHVEMFRQAGDRLDWRRGTLDYLGIVHGSAADHDGVLDLIGAIDRALTVEVG